MGSLTQSLGRLLFVTILISSTYLHVTKPKSYVDGFTHNYTHLVSFADEHLPGLSFLPAVNDVSFI